MAGQKLFVQRRRAILGLAALFLLPATLLAQTPGKGKEKKTAPRADVESFRARVEKILAGETPAAAPAAAAVPGTAADRPRFAAVPSKGHWGILVVDAATGEVLFQRNADSYFTPASNTKLFTTALGLARLGPDFKYRTVVESRGQPDAFGRLRGDLVLVGRGDPNLSNRKFPYLREVEREGAPDKVLAALADQIAALGIRQIEGNIVADDSYFSAERYPSGWAIDDMTTSSGAPVSALAVNDNTLAIEVRPGAAAGDAAWFAVEPWAEFYSFANEVTTVAAPAAGQPPARAGADREPGSHAVKLTGSIAFGAPPQTIVLAVEEPAEYAAALLKRLLEARGVRVYGRAVANHQPVKTMEARTVLAEHTSLPLRDSVRLINKISQNLHTEMLLRTATREAGGAYTLRESLRAAQQFHDDIGIATGDAALFDGSGLSRRNLVTPRGVVTLLRWAAQQPWAEVYRDSLPVAGQDGTLSDRMRDTPAAGRIRAKTGTLGNVNSLSGFAETAHGSKLVFSFFGNHHNLRRATRVLDDICVALVEEMGAPPPKRKRR
jgi:D-alanyl-D-alanine carboxypeptidase/D-alanyl-D-alanine-endopeptidase (penicillin-binding protein 4)